MATYAIGDVQGCYDELQTLVSSLNLQPEDTLWFCGDLVNRGPQSLETLRYVRSLGTQAVTVLGNHDLHLLAVHHGLARTKRSDTLDAILDAPDRNDLMQWLQQQPLLHYDPDLNYVMTHAGVPPKWSVEKASLLANEVENTLRSPRATDFFKHMYGNQPTRWSSKLESWERFRVITNYFTRMRFCTAEGDLEFASKGGVETQPDGFLPWFKQPNRKTAEQNIVFGHWAALEGKADAPHVYALDTGCVWGQRLTAMRLEDKQRFSVPSAQSK